CPAEWRAIHDCSYRRATHWQRDADPLPKRLCLCVPHVLCGGEAYRLEIMMTNANTPAEIRNIVLVHGGFVDGSGWERVYHALKPSGHSVSVVQNPTTSFADDVAVTRRALAALDAPAILVGHSYGGAVITEAGNDPKVVGLVYIAAFAPDAGES